MTTPKNEDMKFTLKVFIDSERNKVVYAEADSDFVDVLCSFLTFPLGTIVRLLEKNFGPQEGSLGSLNTLYDGLKKISSSCFGSEEAKLMLLYPRNSSEIECRKLKINLDDTEPTKYYICEDLKCSENKSYTVSTFNITKCSCGKLMNREIKLNTSSSQEEKGVFISQNLSFIISDDLQVKPNVFYSILRLLKSLGIEKMSEVQERSFSLGLKEVLSLLRCAMVSKTPLSDLFLVTNTKPLKSETFSLARSSATKVIPAGSMKMVLRFVVQKSPKKVVFAQAEEDFINFLFNMLAIPLGSVASLLGGDTSLGSIDNLYKSISYLDAGKYFKSSVLRNKLLSPKLPPQYLSKYLEIFALTENYFPSLSYDIFSSLSNTPITSYCKGYGSVNFNDPKFSGAFVRGPAMYMVTDDLMVTPCSSISCIYSLDKSGISFSGINEGVLNIGKEKALDILKASINTSSALTSFIRDKYLYFS